MLGTRQRGPNPSPPASSPRHAEHQERSGLASRDHKERTPRLRHSRAEPAPDLIRGGNPDNVRAYSRWMCGNTRTTIADQKIESVAKSLHENGNPPRNSLHQFSQRVSRLRIFVRPPAAWFGMSNSTRRQEA
jgi:hypothetical protein